LTARTAINPPIRILAMPRLRLPILVLALALVGTAPARADRGPEAEGAKVPIALAWGEDGRIFVALRDARAVAVVDAKGWAVVADWPLEIRPRSVAVIEGGNLLVGGEDGEGLVVGPDGGVIRHLPLGTGPTRVLALPGGQAALASRWDEAVRVVDWKSGRVVARHALGFAPGAMVRTPGGRVVVADAFGGRLAQFEPGVDGSARLLSINGVNLHGLAVSGDGRELLVAHMAQDQTGPITKVNLDWGLVYSSKLSALRLSEFGVEGRRVNVRRLTLDGSRHGAADPAALAVGPDGTRLVIALAGAHQVLLADRTKGSQANADLPPLGDSLYLKELAVGRSPRALALDPSGALGATADAMSDTLSVFRVESLEPVATVALGPQPPRPTAVQRGEAAFRDGRLAMDRWMSCASCHTDGHTTGLNFDTGGDGNYGAPKNIPSLLGCGPTAPYAWTGRFGDLGEQVMQSLESTLHGSGINAEGAADLLAYLRSLAPAPPRRSPGEVAVARGEQVFRSRSCDSCHAPPLFTRPIVRDVGLDDGPGGHGRFNPPSLRGVSRSAPYLHDGRAKTLREVFEYHRPGVPDPLGADEVDDLVAYLESL
jgi:mono/diheme cytochrome c family protein